MEQIRETDKEGTMTPKAIGKTVLKEIKIT